MTPTATLADLERLATDQAARSPQEILQLALERFPDAAISFSGAEDVALIDMASRLGLPFAVFSLDTGRLHAETYRFIERVRERYGVAVEILFPEAVAVEELVRTKGLFSFLVDGHTECCDLRKVRPLRRKLATVDAWITGQRRDQSPGTRGRLPIVQRDDAFATAERPLVKWNPLAHWTSSQVWQYLQEHDVPINELHRRGFVSVGCEPCTRAILPGEHERAGRWWWEEATRKECGLHARNLEP